MRWAEVVDSRARSSCWAAHSAREPVAAVTTLRGRSPRVVSLAARFSAGGVASMSRTSSAAWLTGSPSRGSRKSPREASD
ncbi:hypothetical protein DVA67_007120 [Solirubrobacter sp. CPCC 204708]|nr:hypothetical protein [Solirubrobacter deserti]